MNSTLKNILTNASKYLSLPLAALTIDGYIETLKNKTVIKKYETELNRNKELQDKVTSLYEDKVTGEGIKTQIIETATRRSESLDLAKNEVKEIKQISADLKNSNLNEESRSNLIDKLDNQVDKFSDTLTEANNHLEKIIKIITSPKDGSSTNNYTNSIFEFIQWYRSSIDDILSHLTLAQQGALTHITVSLVIFFCLLSLVFIYTGDWLIKKFKIEERYPRLAKLIRIRTNIQRISFLFNSLIIFTFLFIMTALDLYVLFNDL